jgi:hypothetical protein
MVTVDANRLGLALNAAASVLETWGLSSVGLPREPVEKLWARALRAGAFVLTAEPLASDDPKAREAAKVFELLDLDPNKLGGAKS